MTMTIDTNRIRCASGSDAISFNRNGTVSVSKRLGYSSTSPAYSSLDIKRNNPKATSGWYWLNLAGTVNQYYIDMDFDGGGWVCVATHPLNVAIPALTYATAAQSHTHSGSSGFIRGSSDPHSYATWLGLIAWDLICSQNGANSNKEVVYYTSGSSGNRLGQPDTHSRRSRWRWSGWNSDYSWRNANSLSNEVGGTTPGFWSSHIAGNRGLTTYDFKQDSNSSNCSVAYGNAPWWFNACWDGNFWGGNGVSGYGNAAYWTSSTSDYYNFGAIYVR